MPGPMLHHQSECAEDKQREHEETHEKILNQVEEILYALHLTVPFFGLIAATTVRASAVLLESASANLLASSINFSSSLGRPAMASILNSRGASRKIHLS